MDFLRFVIVLWAVLPFCAQALTSSDISDRENRRIQEQEKQLRQRQETIPDVRLAAPTAGGDRYPLEEKPCFVIHEVQLRGELVDRFHWALERVNFTDEGQRDPVVGRCLGAQGINLAMKRIQNAIVARGYVTTRVLAQPQDLKSGRLVLSVIPGRLRQIRFAPDTSGRATQWNAIPAKSGDLLNLRDIEQALENFKRVPTVEADIQIVPAEGPEAVPGDSDLVVVWKEREIPFRLSFSVDDSGSKATGRFQGSTTLSYDNALTLNDLFYVSANHDLGGGESGRRGTRGYTLHYSIPLGYWLVSATASENRYHQAVAGANQTYLYSGSSRNAELKVSRLMYRDAVRKSTLSLRGWTRASKNFIDDVEVEVQRRRMAGVELGLSHREFIGTNTLDINLAWRRGTGAMGALRPPEEPFGEGSSRARLLTVDTQLYVPFSLWDQSLRYTLAWRAQWNRTPLVPQDRFSVGGRYTVRGFDGESQLSAERGWLVRNDLGWSLGQSGQELYLGADCGRVGGPSSEFLIGKTLSGGVVGLRGSFMNMSYDFFVGRPIAKPKGFRTSKNVAGFNLNWTF